MKNPISHPLITTNRKNKHPSVAPELREVHGHIIDGAPEKRKQHKTLDVLGCSTTVGAKRAQAESLAHRKRRIDGQQKVKAKVQKLFCYRLFSSLLQDPKSLLERGYYAYALWSFCLQSFLVSLPSLGNSMACRCSECVPRVSGRFRF